MCCRHAMLREICLAQLFYYPDTAVVAPRKTLLAGECTRLHTQETFANGR